MIAFTTPDDLAALQAQLDALDAQCDTLEAQLGALDARVAALEAGGVEPEPEVPIPERARWEAQMLEGAAATRAMVRTVPLEPTPVDPNPVYYDGDRVMAQIAAYTGDPQWLAAAAEARAIYRDGYVRPNQGRVPGYWNFTTGLRLAGDRDTVVLLSTSASYAPDSTPPEWTGNSPGLIREVAYTIVAYIDAEHMGEAKRARRATFVDQLYAHIESLIPTLAPGAPQFDSCGAQGTAPFMLGLAAHAAIRDWEETADPRCLPALQALAEAMWRDCWVPEAEAFWYAAAPAQRNPAPDLNLLIAPLYAWVWAQTGEAAYLEAGDALFAGGVRHATLSPGKHFNQNYWWSGEYVTWRAAPGGA